ncbi:MAG: geranylgeranylglycerol-phosphate geranylgeranyltransferase [Anaerolineales bacterium]|nr:geranylgeranylglycerol-phosphate geranylgeranyltransferase [Anaerolineales bacterium]
MLKGLYKISRPLTTLTGAIAVLLGGYVAGTHQWVKVALAVISTVLVSAAANAWNDYRDIEIDKVNQPERPLPAGLVTPQAAWIFSLIMAGGALLLAALINWPAFLVALAANVLLYIYSWKLKSTVLLGNMTIASISALSAVYGGIAAGNVRPSLWLAAVIVVGILGREVLKTLADYEGDLRQQCKTIATVWGRRAARIVFYLLVAATLVVMMTPYLANVYRPVYAYIVAIGVYPVIIYVMVRVNRERTGRQLEKLSQLMKYDFIVWFLAVLLGAAA